jgi:hypothetical protein
MIVRTNGPSQSVMDLLEKCFMSLNESIPAKDLNAASFPSQSDPRYRQYINHRSSVGPFRHAPVKVADPVSLPVQTVIQHVLG